MPGDVPPDHGGPDDGDFWSVGLCLLETVCFLLASCEQTSPAQHSWCNRELTPGTSRMFISLELPGEGPGEM